MAVAPTLILTAAHCIQDVVTGQRTPLGLYTVVTGSSDLRDADLRQLSRVRRALVYPGFNRFKLHGDAGLLELRTPTTMPAVALAGPSDTALTITAPTFGSGACHGDSGGPALAFRADGTPVQIGITSLGPANCETRLPDIFTRVDRVSGWVGEWIAALAPTTPVEG